MALSEMKCAFCGEKARLNAFRAIHSGWSFSYDTNNKEFWRCPTCTAAWIASVGNVSKTRQDSWGT